MKCRRLLLLAVTLSVSAGSLGARTAEAATPPTKKECVDANESAQDLRRENKLRDARTRLAVCLAATCPGPVREDCAHRLADVDAAVPTLVLVATDGVGNDLSAVHVTLDGQPFVDKLDGKALAVDPGEHRFVFAASGLPTTESTVVVHEGEKDRRVKVVLAPTPPVEITPPPSPLFTTPPPSSDTGRSQRVAGVVLGIAGVAGLITAGVFDLVGKITYENAHATCQNGTTSGCSPSANADSKTAQTDVNVIAPIAAAAGGALLLAGGIVFFTAPKEGAVNVGLTVYGPGAGLGVKGSW